MRIFDSKHMQRTWQLRDELYRIFHQWPVLLGWFTIGGLLGWLAAYLWPAYGRANQIVYVALNPYRAYSDSEFLALARPKYSNLDNYHYWQMSQLETFIFSAPVLQETLDNLASLDPAWQATDLETLREALDAEWRTAGEWELVAVDPDRTRAGQMVRAWSEAAARQVSIAVAASQQTILLDEQLQDTIGELERLERRRGLLEASRLSLEQWVHRLKDLPQAEPLPAADRWELSGLVVNLAGAEPAWQSVLTVEPSVDALPEEYLAWVEALSAQATGELEVLPDQIKPLEDRAETLAEQFKQAQQASYSLSPNLAIERIGEPEAAVVRATSRLALIGAALGLLGYLLFTLIRLSMVWTGITRRESKTHEG